MSLCAADIRVGCILRPCRTQRIHSGVPCEWNELADRQNVNLGLEKCPLGCSQDIIGQEHPIVILKINGGSILYVAAKCTVPGIGYKGFIMSGIMKQLTKDRQSPYRRILELEEHSKLRLPHVYSQSIARFNPFEGLNTSALIYRLDKGSYYRLMDRLGLSHSDYGPEIAPRPTPPVSPPNAPSSRVSTSSTPDSLSDGPYPIGRSKNGPSQFKRRQNTRTRDRQSPLSIIHNVPKTLSANFVYLDKASNKNLSKWVALLRNWVRPYNEQDGEMKSCKIQKTPNPVAEDLPSSEPELNEPPLPYIITLQCTV
ncbi:hypothetical protein BCON_0029g00200 [Botryotinia convoluta]|uniref:Uncharacterized protein n=1 Tax=Botryotinia convoluta TaxID=54673 RepID=A0A4Z1IHN6_9HELO|nr:hypothetical protein BCON_0029g00200 [Botryotinia convoluta]